MCWKASSCWSRTWVRRSCARATAPPSPRPRATATTLVNRSDRAAIYLEIGARSADDLTTCSDVDMMSAARDGRFVHKDGTPYPDG